MQCLLCKIRRSMEYPHRANNNKYNTARILLGYFPPISYMASIRQVYAAATITNATRMAYACLYFRFTASPPSYFCASKMFFAIYSVAYTTFFLKAEICRVFAFMILSTIFLIQECSQHSYTTFTKFWRVL